MRNAVVVAQQYVVTIDNSGCIGEKELDVVKVPNELAAYYSTRVALLEQWCAGSHPTHLFLSNFTGEEAWQDYEKGIAKVFDEIGEKMPSLAGSTESNFQSLQSGLSIMMIGKIIRETTEELCDWFVLGIPLVGQELIDHQEDVVKLSEIYMLLKLGILKRVWPVGSKGIGAELTRLFNGFQVECGLPLDQTSGPASCVIVAVHKEDVNQLKDNITAPITPIIIQ